MLTPFTYCIGVKKAPNSNAALGATPAGSSLIIKEYMVGTRREGCTTHA